MPQLDRLFDYRVPPQFFDVAQPGVRVKVPFRSANRVSRGYLVELTDNPDFTGSLSDIEEIVSPIPVLTGEVWQLARRLADRAAGNASDIVRLAVPIRQVRVEKAYLASTETHDSAEGVVEASAKIPAITSYGVGVVEEAIRGNSCFTLSALPTVRKLRDNSWVAAWSVTAAQLAAFTLSSGKSVIIAVPDYRDQKQLDAALRDLLPAEQIVRLDARQSNPERYRNFLRCLENSPVVIIGNRSVVYAPAKNLGLVLLWDEGDSLHSEPLSPYVHSRDAALMRHEISGCALAFLSHARSASVQRLVEIGFVHDIAQVPKIVPKVIPTNAQPETTANHAGQIPSAAWNIARKALESGPVLLQVARAGYAPKLSCQECRTAARCAHCAGPLQLTSARAVPSCAWCAAVAISWKCSNCESTKIRLLSRGSARTAEELGRAFPGVRVILSDGTHPVLVVPEKPALVVATRGAEPVANGGYAAVLLLDGEKMLARESLTVAEETIRCWSNAVALAAPAAPTLLVGVGGELAKTMLTWQQERFVSLELSDRRQLRFPPAIRVASIRGQEKVVAEVTQNLDAAVAEYHAMHGSERAGKNSKIDVLGPVSDAEHGARSLVRFDYALGAVVAKTLKAAVIKNAAHQRHARTLRVHFDDTEILE